MPKNSLNVPAGWHATPAPTGGTDLRVSASPAKKKSFVVMVWTAAIVWSVIVVLEISGSLMFAVPPPFGIAVAVLLLAFAAWCTFGHESWHLDTNLLEHRVGIGRWGRRRKYVGAELQIVCGHTGLNPTSVPYYRLYAVCHGTCHFLIERDEPELEALQAFIAECTGWRATDRE